MVKPKITSMKKNYIFGFFLLSSLLVFSQWLVSSVSILNPEKDAVTVLNNRSDFTYNETHEAVSEELIYHFYNDEIRHQ